MASFDGIGIGGGAYAAFFTVTVGTTQTALASTTPVYTCDGQISTDGAKDDSGIPTFTLDQIKTDSAFHTFVKTYAGKPTGTTNEDISLESGKQQLGAASTGTTLAGAFKGPEIVGGADNGKIMSWFGLVKVARNSGSVNFSAGTYVKPNLVCIAQEITQDLVIPATVATTFQAATSGVTITVAKSTSPYGDWSFN